MTVLALMDYETNAVRIWMRTVMDKREWSANKWATLAGTSATNITRFLNGTSKFCPSARTIGKLARVAGSQPSLSQIPIATMESRSVDFYQLDGEYIGQMAFFNIQGDNIKAYQSNFSNTREAIRIGDVLVTRKEKKYTEKHLLLVEIKDPDAWPGVGDLVTGRYAVGYLSGKNFSCFDGTYNRVLVPRSEIICMGRVIRITKNLDDTPIVDD